MKNKKIRIALFTFLVVLITISFPYFKAFYLTNKYSGEFKDMYKQTGFFDETEYLMVIDIDEKTATVCYVIKKHAASIIVEFEKNEDVWQMKNWYTIWSKTGSADSLYWPMFF